MLQQHHLVGKFRGERQARASRPPRRSGFPARVGAGVRAIPPARRYPDAAWARPAGSAAAAAPAPAPESRAVFRRRKVRRSCACDRCSAPTCASALRAISMSSSIRESQRAPIGKAALQHKISRESRINDRTFLMHNGDALRARPHVQPAGFLAVEFHASGKRRDRSRDQPQQRGFAAGVGAKNGDEFALVRLKAGRAQRERRRGLRGG